MANLTTADQLRGLILSAVELKALSNWPAELVEDYLNIIDNIILMVGEIDDLIQLEGSNDSGATYLFCIGAIDTLTKMIAVEPSYLHRIEALEKHIEINKQSFHITENLEKIVHSQKPVIPTKDYGFFDLDINFVGGGGLQFGGISYMDSGFDTVLAAQDTWYQVLGFDTNGSSNRSVTPDHTNDHLTLGNAGTYDTRITVASRSAQSNKYLFMVRKNNGATAISDVMVHHVTNVADKVDTGSCAYPIGYSANDTLELWVKRTDGGAVAKTITIEHVNLSVVQIGG